MFSTGSDLKALCSEAVLKALRRVYPQVYDSEYALVIDPKNVSIIQFHIHILVVIALFKLGTDFSINTTFIIFELLLVH